MSGMTIFTYERAKSNTLNVIEAKLNSELNMLMNTIEARIEIMEITKKALNEKNIYLAKLVAQLVKENPELLSTENMIKLAKRINVDEIHITDGNGILTYGTHENFFGFDFKKTQQTKPFLKAIYDKGFTLAQDPTPRGADKKLFQYIGVARIDEPGIVQIGLRPEAIQDLISVMDIQSLIEKISIGDKGYAYVIGLDGTTIAHPVRDNIGNNIKDYEWAKTLLEKEEGKFVYEYNGVNRHVLFKTIGDKKVVVVYPESEFMPQLNGMRKWMIITSIIIVLLMIVGISMLIKAQVIKPIDELVTKMNRVGDGDLDVRVNLKTKDEIGWLAVNFNKMVENMRIMTMRIRDTVFNLKKLIETLTSWANEISLSSEEITKAVQDIASGAINQASESNSSLEATNNLAEKIEKITEELKTVVNNTKSLKEKNELGVKSITELEEKFEENTAAALEVAKGIEQLSEKSKSIELIVETISSIAEQTNLLALNAAIEAARAGESGKGFAVVAEEVRKLAEQSSKATEKIKSIIEDIRSIINNTDGSMEHAAVVVQRANASLEETREVFEEIEASANEVIMQIENLNEYVDEVRVVKDNVLNSIQSISAVAQQSAASAQQISASTQEQSASIQEVTVSIQKLDDIIQKLLELVKVYKI